MELQLNRMLDPGPPRKKPKKIGRKILIGLGIGLLVFLALAQYGNIIVERDRARGDFLTDEEYLEKFVEDVNSLCPMIYEEGIVLKSVHKLPGKTMVSVSEISNVSVDDPALAPLIRMVKEPMIEQIKTEVEFKRLRNMGASFVYRYYDKYGNFIEEVVITPYDYQ